MDPQQQTITLDLKLFQMVTRRAVEYDRLLEYLFGMAVMNEAGNGLALRPDALNSILYYLDPKRWNDAFFRASGKRIQEEVREE